MIRAYNGVLPEIDKSCFIAENAAVVGRVTIGRNTSVWHGAAVRCEWEEIIIGEESNIQDNAVVHTDVGYPAIIGSHVTIGHGAIVHGATVEDSVLVGMGAILMNGVKVGKNSIVGAGALCTENMVIPENVIVVGAPARVLRPIKAQEAAHIAENAAAYVELAEEYRSGQ